MQLSKNGMANALWELIFKMEIQAYPWEKTRGNGLKFIEGANRAFFLLLIPSHPTLKVANCRWTAEKSEENEDIM